MATGRDVFEILAREQTPMLLSFLRGVARDATAADDLLQETLVRAWQSIDSYDRSRPLAPWLRGIAMNRVLEWRRQGSRRRLLPVDEAVLALLDQRFTTLDGVAGDTWADRTRALTACLDELERENRDVVELRYTREQSCDQIAQSLGQGVEWVKKRLQRARAQLGQCVDGKLATS